MYSYKLQVFLQFDSDLVLLLVIWSVLVVCLHCSFSSQFQGISLPLFCKFHSRLSFQGDFGSFNNFKSQIDSVKKKATKEAWSKLHWAKIVLPGEVNYGSKLLHKLFFSVWCTCLATKLIFHNSLETLHRMHSGTLSNWVIKRTNKTDFVSNMTYFVNGGHPIHSSKNHKILQINWLNGFFISCLLTRAINIPYWHLHNRPSNYDMLKF